MFSRRAPLIGSRPESTVQLISRGGGEEAERRYLRSLTIICEQGELKLATRRKDGTKAPPPPSSSPSTSRASPSATAAASATTTSSSSPYYELLFKGNIGGGGGGGTPRSSRNTRSCLLSLWRFPPETTTSATTEAEARDRLQVLARLVGVLFSTTTASRHTQSVQSLQLLFQRLVNSMVGQPGWRAVHIAAHNDLLEYFTSRHYPLGALELNSQTPPDQSTPLHIAVRQGHLALVDCLLRKAADGGLVVNVRLLDAEDSLVFHVAAQHSSPAVLERLLSLAPELRLYGDLKNRSGASPVELAALGGRKEHLRVMMAAGMTARALTIVGRPGEPLDPARQALLDSLDNRRLLDFFSRAELTNGFTFNSIRLGGCPLHWTASSRLAYRLLTEGGLHADTPNFEGETALLRAVRAGRSGTVLTLLAAGGADPRLAAAYGETPLVVAVVGRNAHLVRTLLVFGAGVDERRAKDGASVRHLAASNAAVCLQQQQRQPPPPKDAQERAEILEHLISFGARPCSQLGPLPAEKTEARATPCVEGCLVDQQEAVAQQLNAVYGEPFQPLTAHRLAAEAILEESRRRKGEKEEGPSSSSSSSEGQKTPVMMICFDGGGVRGLITVQILLELSAYLRRRPLADYFDWIAGTSTGSIIGAAVANGRTIASIRALYFRFKDVVLSSGGSGPPPGPPGSSAAEDSEKSDSGSGKTGPGKKPYSSEHLVALLKREFGAETRLSEVTRRIEGISRQEKQVLLVTATRVDRIPARLTLFTSFEDEAEEVVASEEELEEEEEIEMVSRLGQVKSVEEFPRRMPSKTAKNIELWRALRASSAAPFFFNGFPPYVDGGLLANNPTVDCLAEYLRRQRGKSYSRRPSSSSPHQHQEPAGERLRLVLSLGTGAPGPLPNFDQSALFNHLLFFRKMKVHMRTLVNTLSLHGQFKVLLQGTATNSNEPVVGRAAAWAASLGATFYRLNVPLSFRMVLDETDDGVIMRALLETRLWARTNAHQLKALAEVMEALMEVKMAGGGGGNSGQTPQPPPPNPPPPQDKA